jgi:hypothetical protein
MASEGSTSTCRSCDAVIEWEKTDAGKWRPLNPDGTSHFETCPNADKHRGQGRSNGGGAVQTPAGQAAIQDILAKIDSLGQSIENLTKDFKGRLTTAANMYTALAERVDALEGRGTDESGNGSSGTGGGGDGVDDPPSTRE